MKPEAPNSMQRRMAAGSSLAETTITGTPGYCARIYISPEKPRTPGIVEIEQHEIDVAAALEQFDDFVEGARFGDIGPLQQPGHRLAQRAAEQRMVVGDHKPVLHNFIQSKQSLGSRVGLRRTLTHIISPHTNAYPFATWAFVRCSMNDEKTVVD